MKLFKKIAKSLIFPNIIIIILLIPFSLFLLIYSFIYHGSDKIVCYVAYIISAYTLTALCARIPSLMRFIDTVRHKSHAGLRRSASCKSISLRQPAFELRVRGFSAGTRVLSPFRMVLYIIGILSSPRGNAFLIAQIHKNAFPR